MASTPGTDRYRPRYEDDNGPPAAPPDVRKAMYEFQGNQGQGHGRSPRRGEFTFRQGPRPRISDRPLLTERRALSPDPVFNGGDAIEKFRQVDDLTNSEEEETDASQSDDNGAQRPSKRLRSGPSWSNPDPYTALPPVTDTLKKKQDVVKLIRRSRVTLPAQSANANAANGEDFISLDVDDNVLENDADTRNEPPDNAPTGPKTQPEEGSTRLGKRKRDTPHEVNKLPPKARKGARLHEGGMILREWQAQDSDFSTPWYRPPNTSDVLAGVALHQEILDFYEWVRPQAFEQEIRLDVITRLQKTFSRIEPGCLLKPFGSFAAGLYLPTGDMDLVLMTHASRSKFPLQPKPLLYFIHGVLQREGIAVPGSLQPIANAKVPIIKFVDAITGLKVDLSFNNNTGMFANNTFQAWKVQYPAMPILVSVMKQYLMIRGLNDVAFGGLGGFSTICLVTSLIQHHIPSGQVPNLGYLLLNFFYFYGHVFNKQEIAIRLEPPSFVRKDQYTPFRYNSDKPNRLAVVDPNKADNNISGGTAEIDLIFRCFSHAYTQLSARMAERQNTGTTSKSLLVDLLGGDYEAYSLQRERLRRIYSNRLGQNKQPLPPIVSLSGPRGVALPNVAAAGKKQPDTTQANGRKVSSGQDKSNTLPQLTKSQRRDRAAKDRANRLKALRPDIATKVGGRVTVEDAMQLGGYESAKKMDSDLLQRARRMSL